VASDSPRPSIVEVQHPCGTRVVQLTASRYFPILFHVAHKLAIWSDIWVFFRQQTRFERIVSESSCRDSSSIITPSRGAGPNASGSSRIPKLAHRALDPVLWHRGRTPRSHCGSNSTLYGVELDANRAESAKGKRNPDYSGQRLRRSRTGRTVFPSFYLNPPYDFEVGPRSNERMEKLFLGHTYAWLKPRASC